MHTALASAQTSDRLLDRVEFGDPLERGASSPSARHGSGNYIFRRSNVLVADQVNAI